MIKVLVPRLMDAQNVNAQNLNAKSLLANFRSTDITWVTTAYGEPDRGVCDRSNVEVVRLRPRRWWPSMMIANYQRPVDAVFYPGFEWFDHLGLKLRRWCARRVPVICTLEGVPGDETRAQTLSAAIGHRVFCNDVPEQTRRRCDLLLGEADCLVAISPFLCRVGELLYGRKPVLRPLGVDRRIHFHSSGPKHERFTVVAAGSLVELKRPRVFLELASRFPQLDFVWYGEGRLRPALLREIAERRMENLRLPGVRMPEALAGELRMAHLFISPSLSEGAPKVLQEAAACGLPAIAFGFYEPSSVIHGETGFVVWSDDELFAAVDRMQGNVALARQMGEQAARLAAQWDWRSIAPLWEASIAGMVRP
jgi:glycosyltransferase involved in cell wall biosynthesis